MMNGKVGMGVMGFKLLGKWKIKAPRGNLFFWQEVVWQEAP